MPRQSKSLRRWRDAVLLLSAAVAAIVTYCYVQSDFALALFMAAAVCACLLYQAFLGYRSDWTFYNRWVMRIFGAGAGAWLLIATPTVAGRVTAVLLYAALYALCEWIVRSRMTTGLTSAI